MSLLAVPLLPPPLLGLAAPSAASSSRPLAGAEAKRKERGAVAGRGARGSLAMLCSPASQQLVASEGSPSCAMAVNTSKLRACSQACSNNELVAHHLQL